MALTPGEAMCAFSALVCTRGNHVTGCSTLGSLALQYARNPHSKGAVQWSPVDVAGAVGRLAIRWASLSHWAGGRAFFRDAVGPG